MRELANSLILLPDEHFANYVNRLAKANAYQSGNELLHPNGNSNIKTPFLDDLVPNLHELIRLANLDMDELTLCQKSSILSAEWPLLSQSTQDKLVLNLFMHDHPLQPRSKMFKCRDAVCPLCQKEDFEKYGVSYLHRAHQIDYVTVCHRHMCRLVAAGHYPSAKEISPAEIRYASFAASLCDTWFNFNQKQVLSACKQRILERWGKKIKTLYKEIRKTSFRFYFPDTSDLYDLCNKDIPQWPFWEVCALCSFLFQNAQELASCIKPADTESLQTSIGYCVVSTATPLIKVIHADCGQSFFSTRSLLSRSYLCPSCSANLSAKDFIRRAVSIIDGGSYELINNVQTDLKKITLRHNCNEVFTTSYSDFVWGRKRCNCTQLPSIEELDAVLKSHGDFDLVGYDEFQGKRTRVQFRCNKCGSIAHRRYYELQKNVFCITCANEARDPQHYAKQIQQILPEDYHLIGNYSPWDNSVSLYHACGVSYSVDPKLVLSGAGKCPRCNANNPEICSGAFNILDLKKVQEGSQSAMDHLVLSHMHDGLVFADEITEISKNKVDILLKMESARGTIKFVSRGVYMLADSVFTEQELLIAIYVQRNDTRIGYLSGKTFLHTIGILPVAPSTIEIVSNQVEPRKKKQIKRESISATVRGSYYKVDETNYAALQILDILAMRKPQDMDKIRLLDSLAKYAMEHHVTVYQMRELSKYYPSARDVNLLIERLYAQNI